MPRVDANLLAKIDDAKAIDTEIKKLQEKLAAINKKVTEPSFFLTAKSSTNVIIDYSRMTDGGALAKLLGDLCEKKFGKGSFQFSDEPGGKLSVSGSTELIDWVAALVKKMAE